MGKEEFKNKILNIEHNGINIEIKATDLVSDRWNEDHKQTKKAVRYLENCIAEFYDTIFY